MEIKTGIGLGDLIFGMSQAEVKNILGEPDKVLVGTEIPKGTVFYFNKLLIKPKFLKRYKGRMYSIEVHNPEAVMFDQKIIGKPKSDILYLLKSNKYKDIEFEDYESFDTIYCDEIWTTFSFEFNRLKSFEFSPLKEKRGKIIWPMKG